MKAYSSSQPRANGSFIRKTLKATQRTVSLAPNTRRNQTARGTATLWSCSRSNRSCPFAPWGTLFPSLCRGTSGLARSANHCFRLASFNVTREGSLKEEALQGSMRLTMEWPAIMTHGTVGTVAALRLNTKFINSSSSESVSSASNRLLAISCALYVSVCIILSFFVDTRRPERTGTKGPCVNPFFTFASVKISSSWSGRGGKNPTYPIHGKYVEH